MAAARYRALLVLILLSWPSAAKRYSFEHYGQEQGLANALVRALAQDKTGFLWVGTRDGLFRYDGLRFQRFAVPDGLPEASIRTLHVTGEGTLWAGTQKGIARLAGSRLEPVPVEGETRSRLGIASDASGRVYVASSAGLFVAEGGGSLRRVDGPAGAIRGLWVDHDNIVWMGCGEAICRWDGRKSEVFGPRQGVPRGSWTGFQRDAAGALLARADSSLLVMRRDDNVFRKDLQFRFPGSDQLMLDRGGRLLAPSQGGIWMRGAEEHWTCRNRKGCPPIG
ncbi:MAG TPA: two-component regulator propeller domain-containing protein [Bryobacteraceae bacterium]|nr:two-component regulator propeller domain-containing protein [Bryobacteraceae bacterium]